MRVLIVDDDAIVLESCRRILEIEEIVLHTAADTDQALAVLEAETPFDLILTDIKMPGEDGFQLVRSAKKKFPGTAILMMTGYLIPESIRRGKEHGADGFIAKPFTPEELIQSIHETLAAIH